MGDLGAFLDRRCGRRAAVLSVVGLGRLLGLEVRAVVLLQEIISYKYLAGTLEC